ncbi:MAG: alpha/beta fold hydrolase [Actinobacteria bacterium]|nr:alpha/beta fold hydrolase [Actinomycetota bacterium]
MPVARADDGTTIGYRVIGRPSAPPLLMIQGLGADARGWVTQRPLASRYRLICPDNRGVGRSGRPHGPYDLEVMAEDCRAVLDHAGVDSAHVVGASMGGVLAQILAVRHPARVRSLVLACTACRHLPWRRELLDEWADVAQARGMGAFVQQELRWLVGPRSLRRIAPLLTVVVPLILETPVPSFVAQVRAILATDDRIRMQLAGIDVPTLVAVGSQDILTPIGDAEELAGLIPGAQLAIVRGAAHVFMAEKPVAFNRTVRGFLDRVEAGEPGGEAGEASVA